MVLTIFPGREVYVSSLVKRKKPDNLLSKASRLSKKMTQNFSSSSCDDFGFLYDAMLMPLSGLITLPGTHQDANLYHLRPCRFVFQADVDSSVPA